jgi:glucan phosphoethanolaminetransferase (alkaline phosphatase superfamily)
VFWGKDIWKSYKNAFNSKHDDPHHAHMAKHYKETPWWWFIAALVISFVLGLIVVVKEDITLPPWAYVVSLLIGIILAPFVSTLAFNKNISPLTSILS